MKNRTVYIICSFLMVFMMTGLSQSVMAQSIKVAGKVIDKNQEPLIGATVRVVGTQGGTITGIDGGFNVECPRNSTLEISFIGYMLIPTF